MQGAGTSKEAHPEVSEHGLRSGDALIIGTAWSLGGHEGSFGRSPGAASSEITTGQANVEETASVPPEAS